MAKKPDKRKLKKKAWSLLSKIKRLEEANDNGIVECYTCEKRDHWKTMQAGHLLDGRNNAILFEEIGIHPQCLTKDSNLKMFNGLSKSIKNVVVGDRLWGFNDVSFELSFCYVLSKRSFVPDVLYEVELNDGKKFYATGDHEVVANNKWVKIKDMLHNVSAYDIMEL